MKIIIIILAVVAVVCAVIEIVSRVVARRERHALIKCRPTSSASIKRLCTNSIRWGRHSFHALTLLGQRFSFVIVRILVYP